MPVSDCATRLEEARKALHALRTGTQLVEIRHRDRWNKYTPASVSSLANYVRELEAECGGPGGCRGSHRRPVGVTF